MSKRFQNPFMLCATLVAASAIPALPALADNGAPPPPWNVTMGKCSDWKGSWAMQHVGPGHWIGTSVIKVVGTTCASHSLGYQQTANVEFVTHRDRTWTATTTNTKGGPDCTFTLANKEWGFDGDAGWTTSFAAEWEKGQKFPTLAIGHYVDRNAPGSPYGTCEENLLYRPQPGDRPDYSVRTPLAPGFCALSMLFTDWNRSGTPSLRVSNDRQYYRGGEEQMWRIEPGKPPKLYSRA